MFTPDNLCRREGLVRDRAAAPSGAVPLPIGVATLRKDNVVLDIAITNLWLGWTVIGWVFALVWACDTDVEEDFE